MNGFECDFTIKLNLLEGLMVYWLIQGLHFI